VISSTTDTTTTRNTVPDARPRDHPRWVCSQVTAGSMAMLKKKAMTSVEIRPRACSRDSTRIAIARPSQMMRQIVWRITGTTHGGAWSTGRCGIGGIGG